MVVYRLIIWVFVIFIFQLCSIEIVINEDGIDHEHSYATFSLASSETEAEQEKDFVDYCSSRLITLF